MKSGKNLHKIGNLFPKMENFFHFSFFLLISKIIGHLNTLTHPKKNLTNVPHR